jgi:hypothetical protein
MGDALVSQQLHAHICLDLLSIFSATNAKDILITLLPLVIRKLFLYLI